MLGRLGVAFRDRESVRDVGNLMELAKECREKEKSERKETFNGRLFTMAIRDSPRRAHERKKRRQEAVEEARRSRALEISGRVLRPSKRICQDAMEARKDSRALKSSNGRPLRRSNRIWLSTFSSELRNMSLS